ncbi:glycoside hydrolase [Streptomyces sp. NPDC017993]|uniref:glycoside hydrolase n=1 Tax=Streptomyces sp. NPDC017993 TaxID=3365027 RepID=UPI00379DA415
MSGRLLRSACTLALVGAAALTLPSPQVLADPGGEAPPGASSPGASSDGGASGGSPDTGEGGLGRLTEGADSGGPEADGPAGADGTDTASSSAGLGTGALLRKLRSLYRGAEKATEAYHATQVDLRKARKKATVLNARLAKARTQLTDGRADTGRLARLQYQGSPETGLSSYLRILLSKDPEQAMERSHFLKEMAGGQAATIARLTAGEKKADALAAKARSALRKQQKLTARRLKQRAAVREKLTEVEELLASLTEDQLTALSRLEDENPGSTPNALMADGKGGASDSPSPVGGPALPHGLERAVEPPVHGAPSSPQPSDTPGPPPEAPQYAGQPAPHAGPERWDRLPQVPLDRLRPGDLVLYSPDGTRAARYLGHGKVLELPRPGADVRISSLAAHPPLGAVRPDDGAAPTWQSPPRVPQDPGEAPDRPLFFDVEPQPPFDADPVPPDAPDDPGFGAPL